MAQKDRRARTRDPTRGARRGAAAMPYVLTATHTGWSKAFGAPSGRAVKYHGIANWRARPALDDAPGLAAA